MATAKIFRSGNGQALLLPKGFRFIGKTVEIIRRGEKLFCEKSEKALRGLLNCWRACQKTSICPISAAMRLSGGNQFKK